MSANPIVSVVMPAYDAERWVDEALLSAQGQSVQEIEILVVDDGSRDGTAARVEEAAARDGRVRLVRTDNGGVGAARNVGLRLARGSFVAPLDADDVWHPLKLEKQLARFDSLGEDTGLVYCFYHRVDEEGRHLGTLASAGIEGDVRRPLVLRNFVGNASVPMFRKAVLDQVGEYMTREAQGGVQGCEDWDLSLRVAEKWKVGCVKEALMDYRQTSDCMSADTLAMANSYRAVLQAARRRNPDLPGYLFRWSESFFHRYLLSRSYRTGDYWPCLVAASRSLRKDPLMVLDRNILEMSFKSMLWLLAGGRKPRRPLRSAAIPRSPGEVAQPSSKVPLIARVHARRWLRVLAEGP